MNGKRLRHPSLPKCNFGVHFLTAVTYRRIPYFRVSAWARIFCRQLEQARREMGFHVLAFVLMPDHVHLLVWWDPEAHPQLTISTSSPVANSWRKSATSTPTRSAMDGQTPQKPIPGPVRPAMQVFLQPMA